jgi:hypothetical protein
MVDTLWRPLREVFETRATGGEEGLSSITCNEFPPASFCRLAGTDSWRIHTHFGRCEITSRTTTDRDHRQQSAKVRPPTLRSRKQLTDNLVQMVSSKKHVPIVKKRTSSPEIRLPQPASSLPASHAVSMAQYWHNTDTFFCRHQALQPSPE